MVMRDCPGVSAPIAVGSWGGLVIVMIDSEEEVLCLERFSGNIEQQQLIGMRQICGLTVRPRRRASAFGLMTQQQSILQWTRCR
jgi:hypothetical protein